MAYNKKTKKEDIDATSISSSQYQVYINDISWNSEMISTNYQGKKDHRLNGESLPNQLTFDIPLNVVENAKKNQNDMYDIIETFICNTLTRKFMHEVWHCQIWILF